MNTLVENNLLNEEVFLPDTEIYLESLDKTRWAGTVTDLAILTGCAHGKGKAFFEDSLKGRLGAFYACNPSHGYSYRIFSYPKYEYGYNGDADGHVWGINPNGRLEWMYETRRDVGIRPQIFISKDLVDVLLPKATKGYDDVIEVQVGEYPQYVFDNVNFKKIRDGFSLAKETSKTYHFFYKGVMSSQLPERGFAQSYGHSITCLCDETGDYSKREYKEYLLDDLKFIRITNSFNYVQLSVGVESDALCQEFLQVAPITWYLDILSDGSGVLTSKRILLAGAKFSDSYEQGHFRNTDMYEYLNTDMRQDMFKSSNPKVLKKGIR